jgi:hypothetical protein
LGMGTETVGRPRFVRALHSVWNSSAPVKNPGTKTAAWRFLLLVVRLDNDATGKDDTMNKIIDCNTNLIQQAIVVLKARFIMMDTVVGSSLFGGNDQVPKGQIL